MKRYLVWAITIFNSVIGSTRLIGSLIGSIGDNLSLNEIISIVILIVVFSVLGAVIILRTGGNLVGWLMVMLGFVLADPFATFLAFNEIFFKVQNSFLVYFSFWTQGWFYFIIIYAIFLIILNFPNGYPPGPRWKLINIISFSTFAQYILVYTFQPQFGDSATFVDNPISLLPVSAVETVSGLIFGIGLILLAVSSIISIFVRFRRAGEVERSQIKWLLFSGMISFAAIAYRLATYDPTISDWTGYLLTIALLSLAISISIAILRYRLYDIDILIRRTISYAILTLALGVSYFGSVVLLQVLFDQFVKDSSQVVIVLSTLLIAALFTPLRRRIQVVIDRRFYRKKYDSSKAIEEFSSVARQEVELDHLNRRLVGIVNETLQPEGVWLWIPRRLLPLNQKIHSTLQNDKEI